MRRLLILLSLFGCEDRVGPGEVVKPAPVFKASCSTPRLGICTEYTDAAFALGEEVLKMGCTESRGTWSPARCAAQKRLGRCALSGAHRLYYPSGDHEFSAATAAKDCTELYQGSWAAN